MTIWFLPLPPSEERYTAQMWRWVVEAANDLDVDMKVVAPPDNGPKPIKRGQWLDTLDVTHWRLAQLGMMTDAFVNAEFKHGDAVLLGDVWMPGIELLRFHGDMAGVRPTIAGWHYAGTFDKDDLLARTLAPWARKWERRVLNTIVDLTCVGSAYHKRFLVESGVHANRLYKLGLVWNWVEVQQACRVGSSERQKIVVFPHRLAPEKDPEAFRRAALRLRGEFPDWRFVISTNSEQAIDVDHWRPCEVVRHATKDAYYRFLGTCRVWFSAAHQETFGYALHEAFAAGLCVVAPRRACYPDSLGAHGCYATEDHGIAMLRRYMNDSTPSEDCAISNGSQHAFIQEIMEWQP